MVISIINGSPRTNGTTAKILRKMKHILEQKDDVVIQYYDLTRFNITMCKGCMSCYKTGKCVITEDLVEEAADQIKQSDAVIIGSPTYGSYVTSLLKAFMDRGHFIVEQSLAGKYGFSVATYETAEGNKALAAIRKFFLVSGASRKGSILVKTDVKRNERKERALEKRIAKKTERFYRCVSSRQKKSLFEYIFSDIILVPLVFKPAFSKSRDRYEGVFNSWRQKNIIR